LIGLVGGLSGGLLGIGGSIVMIPLMTLVFGPDQHLYQAAAMIVNFFVAVPAVWQHLRVRAVIGRVVRGMLPASAVCVVLGVWASELSVFRGTRSVYLTALFGVFLVGMALEDIRRALTPRVAELPPLGDPPRHHRYDAAWIVGGLNGFVGGLLGVGGGIMAVPLLQRLVGLGLRHAIANSAANIVVVAAIGASFKNYAVATHHGHVLWDSLRLAFPLIPGAVVGSLMGSRLTHVLPLNLIRWIFNAFLLFAAGRMILYAFGA
jgi:uncharacterized membrane protein YfcA